MALLGAVLGWMGALYVFALSHVAGLSSFWGCPWSVADSRTLVFPSALSLQLVGAIFLAVGR